MIETLLDSLPVLFAENKAPGSCLGAAALAAQIAMKECGGKLIFFQTCLAGVGPGALKNREDVQILGTEKERTLYEPQEYFWRKLGQDFSTNGVCVDMFLFPSSYIDVATIGCLSSLSGGNIYNYINFQPAKDGLAVHQDLVRALTTRAFGYDALLRVRCSVNLKTGDHFGNFYMRNATDVELGGVDSDTTIAVSIKHDGKLDEKQECYFQVAMLYTTTNGERRVRIHTISVPNTSAISTVFRCAEMDATMNFLGRAGMNIYLHYVQLTAP